MNVPQTIRTGQLGKRQLRLVRKEARFYGLSDGKICAEGDNADRVWVSLHEESRKFDPDHFGFAGARSRFLKVFRTGSETKTMRRASVTTRLPRRRS